MKRLFGLLLGTILLSSCSLVQDVKFNKDNSGEMSVYIDMKKFVDKMGKGEMPEKTKKELGFFSELNPKVDSLTMIQFLEQTQGISSVTEIKDHEKFQYGMDIKFDNVEALNTGLNRMKYFQSIKDDSTATINSFEYYSVSKKLAVIKEPVSKFSETADKASKKAAKSIGKMLDMKYKVVFVGKKIKDINCNFIATKIGESGVEIEMPADKMDLRKDEVIATIKLK